MIGLFLSYQVQDSLRERALKRVLSRYEVPALPVNIVYPDSRFATMRQRVLTRFLREQLRERVFRADS